MNAPPVTPRQRINRSHLLPLRHRAQATLVRSIDRPLLLRSQSRERRSPCRRLLISLLPRQSRSRLDSFFQFRLRPRRARRTKSSTRDSTWPRGSALRLRLLLFLVQHPSDRFLHELSNFCQGQFTPPRLPFASQKKASEICSGYLEESGQS